MRKRTATVKAHVTLSVDLNLWIVFQENSAARKITASSQVEEFMRKQLVQWSKKEKTK